MSCGPKRSFSATGGNSQSHRKRNKKLPKPIEEGSNESVLITDVKRLLQVHNRQKPAPSASDAESDGAALESRGEPQDRFAEVEVKISELSSTGDGLGLSSSLDHVFVVPFTLPGDVVKAKTVHQYLAHHYTVCDFLQVLEPSASRRNSLVRCPYFARCGGCQLQMLPYAEQLKHKTTIIEKAYRNFSNLLPEAVPAVEETVGSPLQYEYRTKLTPHFDGPPGFRRGGDKTFTEVPPIGYLQKGTRRTIDIEQCPIGTPAVQEGLRKERERVAKDILKYRKGATLLLRESTEHVPKSPNAAQEEAIPPSKGSPQEFKNLPSLSQPFTEVRTCVTDNNAITTEYVGPYKFSNPAGAFFQNNNSILPNFTDWIREHILPLPSTGLLSKPITNLLDTYSGSGLFTITLSPLFRRSLGIDISPTSITSALENLHLNNIPTSSANFVHAADASDLFATAIAQDFDPDETAVVIDPPRKGCDEGFIRQLKAFGPKRICYVSCNVHTQARNVGRLCSVIDIDSSGSGAVEVRKPPVGETAGGEARQIVYEEERSSRACRYELERLQGFDFFPQTGHVESVALLNRVEG